MAVEKHSTVLARPGKPWHQLAAFLAADPAAQLLAYGAAVEAAKARGPPPPHEVAFDGLPAGEHVFELWLPHASSVFVHELVASAGAGPCTIRPHIDPRPRWVTHGSSITHCSEAHSPSRTWPATAAQLADVRLCSLGYGGQCHLDQCVAAPALLHGPSFLPSRVSSGVRRTRPRQRSPCSTPPLGSHAW